MKHPLAIEAIGDDVADLAKRFATFADQSVPGLGKHFSLAYLMPWVAEITGLDERGRLRRRFLRSHKDYSDANKMGSRGVMLYFSLEQGRIYEVKPDLRWQRRYRYFCRFVRGGRKEILTYDQVRQCLTSSTASE